MGAPLDLPAKFPCWCKATYSWGGENKKDLGFIEGDLIEALNAGDGLWWMGRLRRDPRAIGLFPSNFVQVLDESFQPTPNSRNCSPATQSQRQRESPVKNSMFRKPFQAYGDGAKRTSLDNVKDREGTPESDREKEKARKSKFRPYSSMKTAQAPTGSFKRGAADQKQNNGPVLPATPPRGGSRGASPRLSRRRSPLESSTFPPPHGESQHPSTYPPAHATPSRPHSPLPATYHDGSAYPQLLPSSRQPSPNPYQQERHSRAPSPAPSFGYQHSRAPSPSPYGEEDFGGSPPPPPPPAHRIAYQPSRAPSPQPWNEEQDDFGGHGTHTPGPRSAGGSGGMTPSPLRDAMNDVMSSLQDMSVLQQHGLPLRPASPRDVWSPDAYDLVRKESQHQRAQSSLGFAAHEHNYAPDVNDGKPPSLPSSRDGPPQLGDYVQRMERQLRSTQSNVSHMSDCPPAPPLKGRQFSPTRPPTSSRYSSNEADKGLQMHSATQPAQIRHRKSAYELGRDKLSRTYTTKTNTTNSTESSSATQSSTSTQLTSRSIMSGYSAGGFSATSAGSLARRKFGLGSQKSARPMSMFHAKSNPDISSSSRSMVMSDTSGSGPSYHDSHASGDQPAITPPADWAKDPLETGGLLGGLSSPKAKRSGFFKKMIETAKTTAKTGAASARSTIGSRPTSRAGSISRSMGGSGIAGGMVSRPQSSAGGAARDMGLGGGSDWMQVRRDINRSNSLSRREREERAERCEMLDIPVLNPIDQLHEYAEGDEGLDGLAVCEPTDFNTSNLALVDKSTRFIQSSPPMINAAALAQSYVCRPHRSDVQRLRAIFTWVSERINWEEDFEAQVDIRRVIQTKRGCSEEIAVLVRDMCNAVGLLSEVVQGYLKSPGEIVDLDSISRPNHWWNAVIVDGEWRIMDCALANPTNPRRSAYSSASSQVAESWYFLARPTEVCYTHIPLQPEQQHIVPPVAHEILVALPCACPTYFRHNLELAGFDTSLLYMESLEMTHIHVNVPEDVECVAETEARAFAQDVDGDYFESGDVVKKKALMQPEWVAGRKRYVIKALLPGDEGQGVLKIYAGKRGLMHSAKDNPHSLALALPLSHTGQNPAYNFLTRHPTPHAQRHDLYVVQPQCARLVMNNTFVFCVRQHPSSLSRFTPDTWGSGSGAGGAQTPNPYVRPTSAMSMVSATVSQSGSSSYSDSNNSAVQQGAGGMTAAQLKPAKLAIQTPSQKIIRLTRKQDGSHSRNADAEDETGLATSWETVIKIGEKGTWRGLVLADRSARWCVFAEWEAV